MPPQQSLLDHQLLLAQQYPSLLSAQMVTNLSKECQDAVFQRLHTLVMVRVTLMPHTILPSVIGMEEIAAKRHAILIPIMAAPTKRRKDMVLLGTFASTRNWKSMSTLMNAPFLIAQDLVMADAMPSITPKSVTGTRVIAAKQPATTRTRTLRVAIQNFHSTARMKHLAARQLHRPNQAQLHQQLRLRLLAAQQHQPHMWLKTHL
jgi:hypothetical protein